MDTSRVTVVALLLVALLSGCAAVAVGGAAAGGYYVAKDKRTMAEMTDDASITALINSKFLGDDLVSPFAVNVDTYKGVVTLQGTVDNPVAARRAYDLAYSVGGVTAVISQLTIRSDPMTPWGPVNK
jgi:hyperosmotically inducible protein